MELEWNVEDKMRKGEPRDQWMNGVKISIISVEITEKRQIIKNCRILKLLKKDSQ